MSDIEHIISEFDPISLEEMDGVSLQKRTDTKFVFSKQKLINLLPKLKSFYRVLDVDGVRLALYDSIYWDTDDFKFFLDHHNEKPNRFKVRMRKYVYSDLCFLEVKHKIKGQTDKTRIRISDFEEELSEASKEFIYNCLNEDISLQYSSRNMFNRITLVSKTDKERMTLDVGLTFIGNNKKIEMPNLVIGEVKQERLNRMSKFIQILKHEMIRVERVSKYCVGNSLLFDDLKKNRFKPKLIKIEKINNGVTN